MDRFDGVDMREQHTVRRNSGRCRRRYVEVVLVQALLQLKNQEIRNHRPRCADGDLIGGRCDDAAASSGSAGLTSPTRVRPLVAYHFERFIGRHQFRV